MAKTDGATPPDAAKLAAPARVAAFRTGLSAESRAAAFLMAKGYRILAKRFRTPYGEIDLVARKRNLIAIIEVKARPSLDDAAYAVTPRSAASSQSCTRTSSVPPSRIWRNPPTRWKPAASSCS